MAGAETTSKRQVSASTAISRPAPGIRVLLLGALCAGTGVCPAPPGPLLWLCALVSHAKSRALPAGSAVCQRERRARSSSRGEAVCPPGQRGAQARRRLGGLEPWYQECSQLRILVRRGATCPRPSLLQTHSWGTKVCAYAGLWDFKYLGDRDIVTGSILFPYFYFDMILGL